MSVVINTVEISDDVIVKEMDRMRKQYESYIKRRGGQPDEGQLRDWARDNLVERELLRQKSFTITEEIPQFEVNQAYDEIKDKVKDRDKQEVLEELTNQKRVDRLLRKVTRKLKPPAEKTVKQFYTENKKHFMGPPRVRAGHIVKHIENGVTSDQAYQAICDVKKKIDAGQSFELLAKQFSDCPSKHGDLGFFAPGQMVQEFDAVVFNMKADEISDVFQTSFGFHVAKVYEVQESKPVPFDEAKDRISQQLFDQERHEAIEAYIGELKEQAEISLSGEDEPADK